MSERYIVALEIGSSKITGSVGLYDPEDNKLKVIATEQEESRDSVRYGIIQNPEEVAVRVSRIIERLEDNPAVRPRRITGVFVGLSGRSMRSLPSDVKIIFAEETEITSDILRRLRDDATASLHIADNMEILDVVPRSYNIDGLETSSPKGAMGKSISGVYDFIVGRTELKRNVLRALSERLRLSIRGLVITPLAAADIVLSDEEKRLGCMLVDFGAETTSVSIFRKGALCYFATIPLGGRTITRDITSLSILEEKAEEIKCESGRAVLRETPSTINIHGVRMSDVNNLISARAEEIVANVIQQIYYAGLTEKDIPAGIVCIGAGANLIGLLDLIAGQSGLSAHKGRPLPNIVPMDARSKRHDAIEAAAVLYDGAISSNESCVESPQEERKNQDTESQNMELPESRHSEYGNEGNNSGGGFFARLGNRISNLFANPSDDESELD